MFQRFERLVHPYPDALPPPPPRQFFAFLWECSRGVRPYLALVTLFTAAIGAFEALLFSMMAHVLDLLGKMLAGSAVAGTRHTLALLAVVLVASIGFVARRRCSSTRVSSATSRCGCAGTSTA
jgi:ATP-binding cassette subfamily B multidrug efflux pump